MQPWRFPQSDLMLVRVFYGICVACWSSRWWGIRWVPLQLAAVWVPLERYKISVRGVVVAGSSSTSSHVGTPGEAKSQCMVRLLQCMVRFSDAVMFSLTFLVRPTLHSSTDRKNPLLSDHPSLFFFFFWSVVDLFFSSPATVMEDPVGKVPLSDLFPLFLNAKIFSFFPGAAVLPSRESFPPQWSRWLYQIWKKSLTGLEKTCNLPH